MFKWVTIKIKKSGTPIQLNFSPSERIRFFLGLPVRYRGYEICGHFGEREISINLERGGEIPEIPADITQCVRYEFSGFIPRYPNGVGYYGETSVDSRTIDGEQGLYIGGPTTADVKEALRRFTKGELPSVWEPQMARKSLSVTRVRCDVSHYHDDSDIFFSR